MRNPSIELDRTEYMSEMTESNNNEVRFHADSETNGASYKNRIDELYKFRNNIGRLINRNGLTPTTDYAKFLRLKAIDAMKDDVVQSNVSASAKSPILSSLQWNT